MQRSFAIMNRPGQYNQSKDHQIFFAIAVGYTNQHKKTFKYNFEDMTSLYSHLLWSITYSWPTSWFFDAPVMHCGISVSVFMKHWHTSSQACSKGQLLWSSERGLEQGKQIDKQWICTYINNKMIKTSKKVQSGFIYIYKLIWCILKKIGRWLMTSLIVCEQSGCILNIDYIWNYYNPIYYLYI